MGIPMEVDRLSQITADGEWTDEKEQDIKAYKDTIADNLKFVSTVIAIQQPAIQKIIEEHKKNLLTLILEKRMLIGTTVEELTNKDSSIFSSYMSIYKDRQCKEKMFYSWEEFEDLEDDKMSFYIDAIDDAIINISDANIRTLGSMPFFLNVFSYSKDSIHTFLNKPIVELTNYQIHLFSYGTRNLNILSQSEGNPPDNSSPEEICKWYDSQYSIILGKRNKQ